MAWLIGVVVVYQLAELRRPRVLVTEGKISAVHEILPLLEHIAKRCAA
jgi:hypothetical protein